MVSIKHSVTPPCTNEEKKHTITEEDHVVLVDEKGRGLLNPDGSLQTAAKSEAHAKALRHRAISVFVFNNARELLMQRRATGKYHSGGLWSNTCCSHPLPGESPLDAAHRRLWEEMKLGCALREVYQFLYIGEVGKGLYEHEYDHVFVGWSEEAPTPDPEEVSNWKWMNCDDLSKSLLSEPEKYTYWLKQSFADVMERVSATDHGRRQPELRKS